MIITNNNYYYNQVPPHISYIIDYTYVGYLYQIYRILMRYIPTLNKRSEHYSNLKTHNKYLYLQLKIPWALYNRTRHFVWVKKWGRL